MNMDPFDKSPRFIYNPNPRPESEPSFSGTLQIHVHHARNIHNICIYENQDVYAKFSLTYNPDYTLTTKIIIRGGKNPEFNENLIMNVDQMDAVLKCEIWMLSRAKNYMDDQLLGFALVPISSVSGKGKVTQDFSLSSTDLFHSPAGTIKLSLNFITNSPLKSREISFEDSVSKTSELLVDRKVAEDYSMIEFPDMNVVNENQEMVSKYFDFAKNGALFLRPCLEKPDGSFLHLGTSSNAHVEDYEMLGNSSEDYPFDPLSPNGSVHFLGSTMTSLSDDRNSTDWMEKKSDFSTSPVNETPTSNKNNESREEKEEENNKEGNKHSLILKRNVKVEAEESAMQQQIVDMYMRSMHQFTESLAKMKLPMDLDRPQGDESGDDSIPNHDKNTEVKKKDNSRVFYGSRAFF